MRSAWILPKRQLRRPGEPAGSTGTQHSALALYRLDARPRVDNPEDPRSPDDGASSLGPSRLAMRLRARELRKTTQTIPANGDAHIPVWCKLSRIVPCIRGKIPGPLTVVREPTTSDTSRPCVACSIDDGSRAAIAGGSRGSVLFCGSSCSPSLVSPLPFGESPGPGMMLSSPLW